MSCHNHNKSSRLVNLCGDYVRVLVVRLRHFLFHTCILCDKVFYLDSSVEWNGYADIGLPVLCSSRAFFIPECVM